MVNKWRIIFFFFIGSSVYYMGAERLKVAPYLIPLLLILPMLLGWVTCKIYSFLERKTDPQKYILLVMSVFLVLAIVVGIGILQNREWWSILFGLAFCINAVFSMFFDKQRQTNPS